MHAGLAGIGALLALIVMPAASIDPATLRAALADPLIKGFVESTPDADTLEGPFDAASYTTIEYTDSHSRDTVRKRLSDYGFITGYGRTWRLESSGSWLITAVFAFGSTSDASSYSQSEQASIRSSDDTTRAVDTATIPGSGGVDYILDGFHGTDVVFARGNDVYDIILGSDAAYMTADAIAQAKYQYDFAPDYSVPPSQQKVVHVTSMTTVFAYGLIVVLAVAVGLSVIGGMIVLVVMFTRSRRAASPAALVSPDGRYWWDGEAWRPTGSQ